MAIQGPKHVSRIYVKAAPERVWDALTDPHQTPKFFYDAEVECEEWKPGAAYRYAMTDLTLVDGHVLEVDAPRRLVMTFVGRWDDAVAADPPSRISWEMNPQEGGVCEVKVTNDGFDGVNATFNEVSGGMTFLLSALKTWIETGQRMAPGP